MKTEKFVNLVIKLIKKKALPREEIQRIYFAAKGVLSAGIRKDETESR